MRQTITVTVAAASLIAIGGCKNQTAGGGNAVAGSNASVQSAAASEDAINGTWKVDENSIRVDSKPDDYLLQNGTFTCKSCRPAYSVAADGAFHPVKMPYFDSVAIKVVDAHTIIERSMKGDRPIRVSDTTVSADGNTSTTQFTDTSRPGAPAKGEIIRTRVGQAPTEAHLISGQWKTSRLSNLNDAILTSTYKVGSGIFQWSSPNGTSYDARIGGGDTPLNGDIAGTTVSVAKVGDSSYQVTFKRGGKVVGINTITLASDHRLNGVNENRETGSFTRWAAYQRLMP